MTGQAQATRSAGIDSGSSRRTLRALLASALGVLPLCELFTDVRWVFEIWFVMIIAVAPAAILRHWRRPRVMHTWFGLALVVIWLTARYTPKHAFLGLLPTTATWHDVSKLMSSVHETTSSGVAPVHTTIAIKFALSAILALLAALVDLIAVMGRRGALAGVPLLVVFTVSGAVPRHPVSWVYFTGAAIGFLLLLSIDADDEVRGWGRLIPRAGEARKPAGLAVSGPRIAGIALVVAVVLPLIAPARPANLIADAFHNKHGGGGGIGGTFGAGGGVSLDPFDALKGDLQRSKPVNLFTVSLGSVPSAPPFYLRANVLTSYSGERWSASRHGGTERIGETFYDTTPPTSTQQPSVKFTARIGITGLADNPPIFGSPVRVDGVDPGTNWSREDALLIGSRVHNGQQITEDVSQVTPTIADLEAAPADYPADILPARQVPAKMPKMVSDLVASITGGKSTPYAKARALSDYFTGAGNGFTYSLTTKPGNSGSDLVDFLTNKEGFCQQYAGAMGIMLRMAGVPARVVLGYTHANPDRSGSFNVTTNDAHAWVEAYFGGLGWVPFDPTPLVGINGGIKADLPWAPHPAPNTNAGQEVPTVTGSQRPTSTSTESVSANPGASAANGGGTSYLWPVVWVLVGLLVLTVLVLVPASIRWRRRLRRLRAAERGDPDPLWAELSDTAVDLGYVWSPARTPRQVAGWLGRQVDAPAAQSLNTLASAVELSRYARADEQGGRTTLVAELRTVEARLRADRSRSVRVSARLLPASLGWRRLRIAIPRRKRH
jgi:transglutaminase-like putative cysteine protease